ncbi:MAG: tetraacyldisaccharide 4'-kinase [Cyanobacteria bacterium HKST-UBA01]|nr:tetraacyldisaccharide 4'-kinase [Cyanobacteria bacterium HKST-UBA01]
MNLPESKTVKTILKPAAFFYGIGASLKMQLYDQKILTPTKLSAPVISVGNITVGGTGKTPVTIDIAQKLEKTGHKVGILSRGYKRRSQESHVVVSDGTEIFVSCEEAGDEPYLMALSCPGAVVISGSSRIDTGKLAIEKFGCDVIVLDDGYQHVKLERDRNLVLIDYSDNLEEESVLPAGRLREPLSGLGRATDLIITKLPEAPDELHLSRIRRLVQEASGESKNEITTCLCRFIPRKLRSLFEELDFESLRGTKVMTLTGIARPETFISTIESLNLNLTIADSMAFEDHHWFTATDLETIEARLAASKADFILTTEKDLVRLNMKEEIARRTFALVLGTQWLSAPPSFEELWS